MQRATETGPWLAHGFAALAALAGAAACFPIGAKVGGFVLGAVMALNGAVGAALLAAWLADATERVLLRSRRRPEH